MFAFVLSNTALADPVSNSSMCEVSIYNTRVLPNVIILSGYDPCAKQRWDYFTPINNDGSVGQTVKLRIDQRKAD